MDVRTASAVLTAAFAAGTVALSGCGAGSQGAISSLPVSAQANSGLAEDFLTSLSAARRNPEAPPRGAKPPKELAVASWGYVRAVEILNSAYRHVATIGKGINGPTGAFYDAKGNLYVANVYGHNVTEYNTKKKLTFTYSAQLSGPTDVTVDVSGNVYVADWQTDGVVEYPQGSNSPIFSCGTGLSNEGIAVDEATGDVFVSATPGAGGALLEYKGGLSGCHATTLGVTLNDPPSGLQIDKKRDLVTDDSGAGIIEIIAPPYTSVTSTIAAQDASSPALTKSNRLIFVVDAGYGVIYVDDYPSGRYVTTLNASYGILSAWSVASFPDL